MSARRDCTAELMRIIQLSDSAFPVGTFSFSNGLETAAQQGIVHDAETLRGYVADVVRTSAHTDGIAALHAWRSCVGGRYEGVAEADDELMLCKMNTEARQMLRRMGKKLSELAATLVEDPMLTRWLDDVQAGRREGSYPVAQGVVFAACGVSERGLFCSLCYGAANMVLGAALRCVRVSHYHTQRILFDLSSQSGALYDEIRDMRLDEMHAFVPQIDILASMHEKGASRMFMN